MRPANPYADLRALLDSTRQLDPEEVAELQLEQGYAERALAIYETLLANEPSNPSYRRRRDWLARMATVRQRPVRCISASSPPPSAEPAYAAEPVHAAEPAHAAVDTTLRGVRPPPRQRERGTAGPAPARASRAVMVRRLQIVGVG